MTHLCSEQKRSFRLRATACLAVALASGVGHAADAHPDLTRLSATEEIWVDVRKKEVVLGGRIAVDEGAIELFACPAGTKEHESIVAVNASPRLVYAALLAIGMEPGTPAMVGPEFVAATGPAVAVRVRWRGRNGEPHEADGREWVRDVRTGLAMREEWVFPGGSFRTDPADGSVSQIGDGADLICVCNFPESMIDLGSESSSGNERLLFEAFRGHVPPCGTNVELLLRAMAR